MHPAGFDPGQAQMGARNAPLPNYKLTPVEWEVLYLLYDALDQLRKMTLSFSELRYLAVEHTEPEVSLAVEGLLNPGARPGNPGEPLIVPVPNLADLPIYRITSTGRDIVKSRMDRAR